MAAFAPITLLRGAAASGRAWSIAPRSRLDVEHSVRSRKLLSCGIDTVFPSAHVETHGYWLESRPRLLQEARHMGDEWNKGYFSGPQKTYEAQQVSTIVESRNAPARKSTVKPRNGAAPTSNPEQSGLT